MGKERRAWRKLVKKLRRQKKRRERASFLLKDSTTSVEQDDEEVDTSDYNNDNDESVNRTFFLTRTEWEEREEQAQLEFAMVRALEHRLLQIEEANQKKIREEWEAKQEQDRKIKEEKERLEKQLKEKQEAEFNEFLSFLSGDIETPPTRYLMSDVETGEDVCYYFSKTATCRFYERCTKSHPRPTLSTAILIPNFFSHFKLEQSVRDEYDSDLGLEYDDSELHQEFLEFYEDVVPELRKFGTLIQFKVCCNLEPHLRGNVYVQYQTIQESVEAFRKFNGRFYNGRQLSLQFIKMDSWRSAICGMFLRKACVKGRTCNYLHVFRNPTKEFVKADHDWKESIRHKMPTMQNKVQMGPRSSDKPVSSTLEIVTISGRSDCDNENDKQPKDGAAAELPSLSKNSLASSSSPQRRSSRQTSQSSHSHKTSKGKKNNARNSSSKVKKKSKKAKHKKKNKKHKKRYAD